MPGDNDPAPKQPKGATQDLQKAIAELQETVGDLLIAMADISKFNGRDHMPEGSFQGKEY